MNGIFHLFRQISDSNRSEGAFANTYPATYAKVLGYEGLTVYEDYGLVASANRRAEVLAFFGAFPGLAAIAIDDGYPHSLPQLSRSVHVTSQRAITMNST
jgi:hypothetical protein